MVKTMILAVNNRSGRDWAREEHSARLVSAKRVATLRYRARNPQHLSTGQKSGCLRLVMGISTGVRIINVIHSEFSTKIEPKYYSCNRSRKQHPMFKKVSG